MNYTTIEEIKTLSKKDALALRKDYLKEIPFYVSMGGDRDETAVEMRLVVGLIDSLYPRKK